MNSRRSVCSYDVMVKRQQDARRLEQLHPSSPSLHPPPPVLGGWRIGAAAPPSPARRKGELEKYCGMSRSRGGKKKKYNCVRRHGEGLHAEILCCLC